MLSCILSRSSRILPQLGDPTIVKTGKGISKMRMAIT